MSEIELYVIGAIVTVLVTALGGLFLRVRTNESKVAVIEDQVKKLEGTASMVHSIDKCQGQILERLQHLPTHKDLDRLHDRISKQGDSLNAIRVDVSGMKESQEGTRRAVDRLHQLELARASATGAEPA